MKTKLQASSHNALQILIEGIESMLCDLTTLEIDCVSGGDGEQPPPDDEIIVNGVRVGGFSDELWSYGGISETYLGCIGLGPDFENMNMAEIVSWLNGEWVDTDGDGVPDSPPIIVDGPPRMAESLDELDASQRALWLVHFFTFGNDILTDTFMGTNISGENPDNPYTTDAERAETLGDAVEELTEQISETSDIFTVPD